MPDTTTAAILEKAMRLEALKLLAQEVKNDYATKAALKAVSDKVDTLTATGGEPNVLNGVKVNGTALTIAEKMVDILFATGTTNGTVKMNGVEVSVAGLAAMAYKANVSQDDLDAALQAVITAKANSADVYTKNEIDGKISSVYKPGGSVAFASLPTADEAHLGLVYNVTDKFTTTADFVEGAGAKHPAGANVVVIKSGEDYKYDVLAGFVDLSEYAKIADVVLKEDGKRLMTDAESTKLEGIATGATKVEASETSGKIKINGTDTTVVEFATTAEVTAMLNEVFAAE